MGLALCHSLPRDVTVQVALLLFFVALVLQAAAIGLHTRNDGGGYFTLRGTPSSRSNALVLLAAHPATYIPTTSSLHTGTGTADQKLCNPSAATLTYACARFAESFHIVNGLTLTSFITNFVVLVMSVFALVRLSHSTLGLLFRLTYAASVPMALQCAAVGCFFARTVPHARRDTAAASGFGYGLIKFHRRPAADLMIAATALLGAGFVIVFVRWMSVICLRIHFEEHKDHSEKEVKQLTEAHMVNDDWTRQKQILLSHARSVQVEMAVKNPHKSELFSASATARNSEPFPPRPLDVGTAGGTSGGAGAHHRRTASSDSSDADTLRFRTTSGVTPLTGYGSPGRNAATAGGDGKTATFESANARTGGDTHPTSTPTPSPPPPPAAAHAAAPHELGTSADDMHAFSVAEGRNSAENELLTPK